MTICECFRLPLVPVTVSVKVPRGELFLVETVSEWGSADGPTMLDGLNEAFAPPGRPPTDSETVPLKPFRRVIDTE